MLYGPYNDYARFNNITLHQIDQIFQIHKSKKVTLI